MIHVIGEDPDRDGLKDTPDRIINSWKELFAGYEIEIEDLLKTFENDNYDQMVLVRDIDFTSFCEHHWLPFQGVAHVAYLPGKQIVGLSKLARVVECYSKRLQVQERMTEEIALAIHSHLEPKGTACVVEASHLCMGCRGVKKPNAVMVTSALFGAFKNDPATRAEFMAFVNARR